MYLRQEVKRLGVRHEDPQVRFLPILIVHLSGSTLSTPPIGQGILPWWGLIMHLPVGSSQSDIIQYIPIDQLPAFIYHNFSKQNKPTLSEIICPDISVYYVFSTNMSQPGR